MGLFIIWQRITTNPWELIEWYFVSLIFGGWKRFSGTSLRNSISENSTLWTKRRSFSRFSILFIRRAGDASLRTLLSSTTLDSSNFSSRRFSRWSSWLDLMLFWGSQRSPGRASFREPRGSEEASLRPGNFLKKWLGFYWKGKLNASFIIQFGSLRIKK